MTHGGVRGGEFSRNFGEGERCIIRLLKTEILFICVFIQLLFTFVLSTSMLGVH